MLKEIVCLTTLTVIHVLFIDDSKSVSVGSISTNNSTFSIKGNATNDIFKVLDQSDNVALNIDFNGNVSVGSDLVTNFPLSVEGIALSMVDLTSEELEEALSEFTLNTILVI